MLLTSRASLSVRPTQRPTTTLCSSRTHSRHVLVVKAAAVADYKESKKEAKEMKREKEAKAEKKRDKEIKAEKKDEKSKRDKEERPAKEQKTEVAKMMERIEKKERELKMQKPDETLEAEGKKALKAERKRLVKEAEARGALFALHWCVAPKKVAQEAATTAAAAGVAAAGDPTAPAVQQFISSLQMDLKRMEKVAKDAVWYLTKEAEDGLHVVLVTANAKLAIKHALAELPAGADTHVLSLGAAGEVEVPVATLHSMVMAQKEDSGSSSSDSSDSEEEEKQSKGVSKAAKTALPGGMFIEGDVDAAIAAALASVGASNESNELDSDAPPQYPPFRSFL